MSFWKNNKYVPSWPGYLSSYWNKSKPHRLVLEKSLFASTASSLNVRIARQSDLEAIQEFWYRYFSISSSCRCTIPLTRIQEMSRTDEIWVVVVEEGVKGIVVGTIVRRFAKRVHVEDAYFPQIGVIDYFCVHPAWRSRGVGRKLLQNMHNTNPGDVFHPHFFLWEGFQAGIPPIASGVFWSLIPTTKVKDNLVEISIESIWHKFYKSRRVWSEESSTSDLYAYEIDGLDEWIVIQDTHHVTVPEGKKIGILVGQSSNKIEISTSWELLFPGKLMAETISQNEWRMDSPYQWISYNLQTNSLGYGEYIVL